MKGFRSTLADLALLPETCFGPPGGALDLIGVSEFDIASTATTLAFSGKLALAAGDRVSHSGRLTGRASPCLTLAASPRSASTSSWRQSSR